MRCIFFGFLVIMLTDTGYSPMVVGITILAAVSFVYPIPMIICFEGSGENYFHLVELG